MIFLHPDQLTNECKDMANQFELYCKSKFPGKAIEVTSDWDVPGTHSAESMHYSGRAVDLRVLGVPLLDQWVAASRIISVRGLGGYPYWRNPGLHLDCRPVAVRALWWRDEHLSYDRPMREFFQLVSP